MTISKEQQHKIKELFQSAVKKAAESEDVYSVYIAMIRGFCETLEPNGRWKKLTEEEFKDFAEGYISFETFKQDVSVYKQTCL